MKIRYNIVKGSYQLSRLAIDLSKEAQVRLSWFDSYRNHQYNARLTCRHFGISPQTFYRWQKRYDLHHRKTLETRSRRPKRVRQPAYTLAQIEAVRKVRECYPHRGKDKLAVVLRAAGYELSVSLAGRIIPYLKKRNVLRESIRHKVSSRKYGRPGHYAVRKPQEYQAKLPAELVQLDTMDIPPLTRYRLETLLFLRCRLPLECPRYLPSSSRGECRSLLG